MSAQGDEIDVVSFVEHISNFTGAVRTVDRNLDRIATALERLAGTKDEEAPPVGPGLKLTGG